jgi:hypothetical protein
MHEEEATIATPRMRTRNTIHNQEAFEQSYDGSLQDYDHRYPLASILHHLSQITNHASLTNSVFHTEDQYYK